MAAHAFDQTMALRDEIKHPGLQIGGAVFIALSFMLGQSVGNIWAGVVFGMAAYAVVANDVVQVFMTFINSNRHIHWFWLYLGALAVLTITLWAGFYAYQGDISYGRLDAKGYIPDLQIQWYHTLVPGALIILTKFSHVPVSTSLIMLLPFTDKELGWGIVEKSMYGYAVAFFVSLLIWYRVEKYLKENPTKITPHWGWRVAQWGITGLLLYSWLTHDTANMAVVLPKPLTIEQVALINALLGVGLAYTFWQKGGAIGNIVTKSSGTDRVIPATMIDLFYFAMLIVFKEWSQIPMSTTWVFIGLIAGREFAIRHVNREDLGQSTMERFNVARHMAWKNTSKLLMGFGVSYLVILLVERISNL